MRVDFATVFDCDRSRCERGRPQNLLGHADAGYLGVDRLKPKAADRPVGHFFRLLAALRCLANAPCRPVHLAWHGRHTALKLARSLPPPASGWTM